MWRAAGQSLSVLLQYQFTLPPQSDSTVVLLLISTVQLPQLLLSHPSSLVGFGGAAGASGLGRLGAVAAGGRPLQEVLGYTALEVLHGRRRSHADDPGMLEGLAGRESLAGVHRQNPFHEVLGQVGHAGPWLQVKDTCETKSSNFTVTALCLLIFFLWKQSHLSLLLEGISSSHFFRTNFKVIFLSTFI